MRRILLGVVGLLLAGPVSAQVSQIRSQRTIQNKAVTVGDTTILTYVSQDSFRTRVVSRFKPADSVAMAILQRALGDSAAALVTVRAALKKAQDSLAKWPTGNPPPPPPVDTTPPCCPAPPPVAGSYPNRPASYTKSSVLDFSQPAPGDPKQNGQSVDAPIIGSDGWAMYGNVGWKSNGNGTWTATFPAGAHGTDNAGGGWGVGNFFRHMPERPTRLYAAIDITFTGPLHKISNKWLNIECSNSLLLVQLREGNYVLHAEQLINGGASFWVDGNTQPNELHLPGRLLPEPTITTGVPHKIETLIDPAARTWKIWLDGVLTTNASNLPFSCSNMVTIGWNAFRGGGGETNLPTDVTWTVNEVLLAW